MTTDWDVSTARSSRLTARQEAQLIRDLAKARAEVAARHPKACRCTGCHTRTYDTNRRHTAALVRLAERTRNA